MNYPRWFSERGKIHIHHEDDMWDLGHHPSIWTCILIVFYGQFPHYTGAGMIAWLYILSNEFFLSRIFFFIFNGHI
jgi:hypothetical protein